MSPWIFSYVISRCPEKTACRCCAGPGAREWILSACFSRPTLIFSMQRRLWSGIDDSLLVFDVLDSSPNKNIENRAEAQSSMDRLPLCFSCFLLPHLLYCFFLQESAISTARWYAPPRTASVSGIFVLQAISLPMGAWAASRCRTVSGRVGSSWSCFARWQSSMP